MIFLRKLMIGAAALSFLASPALAQTGTTAPAAPMQDDGAQQPPDGSSTDSMREMMREMMQEMMRNGTPAAAKRGDRVERRDERRHHGGHMGRMSENCPMMRGEGGMRSGMMRGAGMRMMFAIIDADGDGALSLAEIQDFHGRIFNAVDENGDGGVRMDEIRSFFHGAGEESAR